MYEVKKISTKMSSFYELSFADFAKDLGKGKTQLTETQKFELMDLFETQKLEVVQLKCEIQLLDKELDEMVFNLYGISEEEKELIMESLNN
jgi:hypothetical protein